MPAKVAKKQSFNEAAAIHFATGAMESQEVPVGLHDLSGVRVTLDFPAGSAVFRGPGSEGDGYDQYFPSTKGLTLVAVLMFLDKCSLNKGPKTQAIWNECVRRSAETGVKAEDLIPVEAKIAVEKMQEFQPDCKARRRTSAKRLGLEGVKVTVAKL